MGRSGKQTRKFDIRPAPTPVVYVGSLPFFAKALPDPEAVLPASVAFEVPSSTTAGSDSTYYLDPGISPTTTEFTPVLASGYTRSSKGDVVQAMVVRPMSLIDPVLPPGYGFAVIDSSCAVLFHSDSFRDMKENFCQESKGTSELKPWLFGGIDSSIDISYAGQPERAFISPMNIADMKAMGASSKVTMPQFAGGPAYLVVFRTADYALTLNLTIMVVCSLLLGGYFIVILLLIAFDISLRGPMQLVTAPRQMWPCSENSLKVCTHLHRECGTPYALLASLFTTLRSSFIGSDSLSCYSRASFMVSETQLRGKSPCTIWCLAPRSVIRRVAGKLHS